MRLGVVILVLVSVLFGATFGALNSDRVVFDVYLSQIELPKGAALLAALLTGWILGGLVVWSLRVLKLRRELKASRRTVAELRAKLELVNANSGPVSDEV